MSLPLRFATVLVLGQVGLSAEGLAPDPLRPEGRLQVNRMMVRQGVQPRLDWEVRYPARLSDLVTLGSRDHSLTTKRRVVMEVRLLEADFRLGTTHPGFALQSRIGGRAWKTLFFGRDDEVKRGALVQRQLVEPGRRIDFSARAQKLGGSWYSSRTTLEDTPMVVALTKQDALPPIVAASHRSDPSALLVSSHSGSDALAIGPSELLYLFELYSTDPSSSYFNLRDLAVVVSFREAPDDP